MYKFAAILITYGIFRYWHLDSLAVMTPILLAAYLIAGEIKQIRAISERKLWFVACGITLLSVIALAIFAFSKNCFNQLTGYGDLLLIVISCFLFTPYFALAMLSGQSGNRWITACKRLGCAATPFALYLAFFVIGMQYLFDGLGGLGD